MAARSVKGSEGMDRREALRAASAGAALGAVVSTGSATASTEVIRKGRIRQSIVHICRGIQATRGPNISLCSGTV